MPQSGGCGPSHLSSALAQVADHDPQHALPEVLTSKAQIGDGAILCFQELRANYKNKNRRAKEMLIFLIFFAASCQISVKMKKQTQRLFPPYKTLPKQKSSIFIKQVQGCNPHPTMQYKRALEIGQSLIRPPFIPKIL